jgi:hypothetical protein
MENTMSDFLDRGDIQQHEWEMRVFFRRVLDELKPQFTVELGSWRGGMAALLSLSTTGKTISLDIDDYGTTVAWGYGRNLEFVPEDARTFGCPEKIVAKLGGLIDLLFVDDGHCYDDHVIEFALWKPFVRPGGWICFHDINPLANIGPGGVHPSICQTNEWWQTVTGHKEEIIATAEHKEYRGVIPHGGIGILHL